MDSCVSEVKDAITLFTDVQKYLTEEQITREVGFFEITRVFRAFSQDIRARVRELEQVCREVYAALQPIHHCPSSEGNLVS